MCKVPKFPRIIAFASRRCKMDWNEMLVTKTDLKWQKRDLDKSNRKAWSNQKANLIILLSSLVYLELFFIKMFKNKSSSFNMNIFPNR